MIGSNDAGIRSDHGCCRPLGRVTGRERASFQFFLTGLAATLDLPAPEPAEAGDEANEYCFERRVAFRHGDGIESYDTIDLYQRARKFRWR